MGTALDLAPEERQRYLQAVRRRMTRPVRGGADSAEAAALLARVREAAAELKARFGARRVILFGSLAHGAWEATGADLDLAVEGLSAGAYWQAWAVVEARFPERPVDLVALESVTGSLRSAIQGGGKEL